MTDRLTEFMEDHWRIMVFLAAATVTVGMIPATDIATDAEAATTIESRKYALVKTATCAVDDNGACQRAETLNFPNETNAGAGANEEQNITAEVWVNETASGLIKIYGKGDGFIYQNSSLVREINQTLSPMEEGAVTTSAPGSLHGYVSLIYRNSNEKRCPRAQPNQNDDIPGTERDNDFQDMLLGYWDVEEKDPDGDGRHKARLHLNVPATEDQTQEIVKTGPVQGPNQDNGDSIDHYNTLSVRRIGHNSTAFQAQAQKAKADFDPGPATFQLRACGDFVDAGTI